MSLVFLGTDLRMIKGQDTSREDYLRSLFDQYHERRLILFPLDATMQGDNRYNDRLAITSSPDHVAECKRFYLDTQRQLRSAPAGKASSDTELAAEILEYELSNQLEGIAFDTQRIPMHQFDGLHLVFAQLGSGSSSQPFKSVKDYENWLGRINDFEVWCNASIESFRRGIADGYVLPKILVERMIKQLLDPTIVTDDPRRCLFYAPITNLPANFPTADKARLTEAYQKAIADQIIPAYRRLGEFLRDEYLPRTRTTSGIGSLINGSEQYAYWVKTWTTTSLTPDAIFSTGEAEVARIRGEMEKVQKQLGFQGTLQEFFQHVRTDRRFTPYKNAEEVLQAFRDIQAKIEPKLDGLFLMRPKTPFEIRRTESFREATASAEYMPGSADGSRPGIFYLPLPEPAEFNITSGMDSLFAHEAIPGHHFQISLQQENQRLPKFIRFIWYGAYGEGWALYCESIGRELGLYTQPEQYLGALGDEMHRAIRLVVDVGLHQKGWSREQAIEYMMKNEPISEQSAVAEIERYMAMPGQALSYKIGSLQIRKWREQYQRELGDKFQLSAFHDQILRDGGMPLSILQRKLDAWAAEIKR
ncbi:MAG: hypothetical protein RL240_4189 [Planctomycetota bacterium]|jgi:uncharacterized protein (DUF885 family)